MERLQKDQPKYSVVVEAEVGSLFTKKISNGGYYPRERR